MYEFSGCGQGVLALAAGISLTLAMKPHLLAVLSMHVSMNCALERVHREDANARLVNATMNDVD